MWQGALGTALGCCASFGSRRSDFSRSYAWHECRIDAADGEASRDGEVCDLPVARRTKGSSDRPVASLRKGQSSFHMTQSWPFLHLQSSSLDFFLGGEIGACNFKVLASVRRGSAEIRSYSFYSRPVSLGAAEASLVMAVTNKGSAVPVFARSLRPSCLMIVHVFFHIFSGQSWLMINLKWFIKILEL